MALYDDRFQIITDLENSWVDIKKEYESVISEDLHMKWPETFLYKGDWNVFGLTANYQPIGNIHDFFHKTASILKKYDTLICNAGFSVLKPNTIIHKHRGYTNKVLRCHLGITIPEGDCALQVEDNVIRWKNGRAFIFDDTLTHSAWNITTETRTIMLLDLDKDLLLS